MVQPLSQLQEGLRQHPWAGRPLVAEHEPLSQPALGIPVNLDQSLYHLLMGPSAAQATTSLYFCRSPTQQQPGSRQHVSVDARAAWAARLASAQNAQWPAKDLELAAKVLGQVRTAWRPPAVPIAVQHAEAAKHVDSTCMHVGHGS